MPAQKDAPTTLLEAVRYFANEDVALAFVANLRWPDGNQVCPKCGSEDEHYFLKTRRVWKCRDCSKQFSIKVGTIFEDSPISLSKWLPAMWLLANSKNGISSYELGRALGVTQKTAWFMLHRIRLAMQSEPFMLNGEVEADETYIGGKARNMPKARRERVIKGRGMQGKVAVLGLLQRHGENGSKVQTHIVQNTKRKSLQGRFGNTSSAARKCSPTPLAPTVDSKAITFTKSSTMPSATRRGTSTPTGSKTSGACLSG